MKKRKRQKSCRLPEKTSKDERRNRMVKRIAKKGRRCRRVSGRAEKGEKKIEESKIRELSKSSFENCGAFKRERRCRNRSGSRRAEDSAGEEKREEEGPVGKTLRQKKKAKGFAKVRTLPGNRVRIFAQYGMFLILSRSMK